MKYFVYFLIVLSFSFIYFSESIAKDNVGASEDIFRLLTSAEAYINLGDYDSALNILDKAEKLLAKNIFITNKNECTKLKRS